MKATKKKTKPYPIPLTPYTIHLTPYTLPHTPYTIHHTPYPIPHTPYPIPHTPYIKIKNNENTKIPIRRAYGEGEGYA